MMRVMRYVLLLIAVLVPGQMSRSATWSEEYSKVSLFYLYNTWQESSDDQQAFADHEGDYDLGEGVLGIKARHVFTPQLTVDFWGALTSAKYANSAADGDEISLSSLSDTRLKGTYYFQDRLFSAALSVNLPTGKTALSAEEYLVAMGVADNSRKYIVRRFGQGLDVGGEVFILPHVGDVACRLGGGYIYKGSYQLRRDAETEYKFGDELFAGASIELSTRPVGFSGGVMYKSYLDDEVDSRAVFRQGNTIVAHGRLTYNRRVQGAVGFNLISRGPAKIAAEGGELTEESIKSGRNEVQVYASGSHPLNSVFAALARLEYQTVTANDYDEDSAGYRPGANYIGIGGGINARLSLGWSGNVLLTYYFGSMDNDHDLTGLEVAAALTFRYW